jgi:sulfur-carrier protein
MPLIFIPAQMRNLTGGLSQIELSGATVRELVEALEHNFPGTKARLCQNEELMPGLQVTIDNQLTQRGLRAKVSPTSEVHFLPAIGGG